MKNSYLSAAGLLFILQAASVSAAGLNGAPEIPMVNIENAIEADHVSVTGSNGDGFSYVVVKACDTCKSQTLKAQPSTLYKKGNTTLSANQVSDMKGKAATVIYSTETNKVTRVIYFDMEGQ